MGSLPTFDPNVFTVQPVPEPVHKLISASNNYPLLNRAIDSAGPTGSTFKPITATAALQSGNWTTSSIYDDTGSFCTSPGVCRHNAGRRQQRATGPGQRDPGLLRHLLLQPRRAYQRRRPDRAPQRRAAADIGRTSSGSGRRPGSTSPVSWRARCPRRAGAPTATSSSSSASRPPGRSRAGPSTTSCGIADGRPWSIGDNINLAVGQGDVQVTPLQLAVAYSALANGGTVVRPHVGLDVQNQDGTVLQKINPPPSRHININPLYLETIRAGLRGRCLAARRHLRRRVLQLPRAGLRQDRHRSVQRPAGLLVVRLLRPGDRDEQADRGRGHVEQGGFGAVAAAPVARQILSQWFFGKPGAFVAGSSKTL